ncbi:MULTISPECIES: FecR family protein [Sphingobacterium]|uniref:FecR family protein n=1 Tax=Sphingobacterium TaxID=28453 RepID=UPI0013D9249C|nr:MULTISPECIES: FecR family protein [unclassified Sphingobacterium]
MKEQKHIKHIFFKYLRNEYSREDLDFLLKELASNDSKRNEFEKLIEEALDNTHGLEKLAPEINHVAEWTLQSLRRQIKPKSTTPIRLLLKIAAAVVAVVGLSIAAYQWTSHTKVAQPPTENIASTPIDMPPGRNQAVISIDGGEEVIVDDGEPGIESSNKEIRYSNGLALTPLKPGDIVQVRTPKGGQFQVTLPDGTKVWLNAESILRYPSQFGSTERSVSLIGEAYFEVNKDSGKSKRSFVVKSDMQEIKVLGTHFNVSAYPDELQSTTTLIEGAVHVTALNSSIRKGKAASEILRPGQQSVLRQGVLKVANANVEKALAWKNNMFIFNNTPLEEVMKTIARWYDVEIYYQDRSTVSEVYAGSITRYENLSKVLGMLEKAGDTRFKLEEGRVVVMK